MSKPVKATVKLRIAGGAATPAPPVSPVLGPHGVNLMDFCKKFNAESMSRKGETVPVIVTVYQDRTFAFVLKTPATTDLIKKKAKLTKGSARPHTDKVGRISWADVEEIAKIKMPDLNAADLEQAKKTIAGSARSMGVVVE